MKRPTVHPIETDEARAYLAPTSVFTDAQLRHNRRDYTGYALGAGGATVILGARSAWDLVSGVQEIRMGGGGHALIGAADVGAGGLWCIGAVVAGKAAHYFGRKARVIHGALRHAVIFNSTTLHYFDAISSCAAREEAAARIRPKPTLRQRRRESTLKVVK